MSTEAATPVASTTPYKLTRGGAYLLEGLLQQTGYTTTEALTRKAARLRRKIRQQNPCKAPDGTDFEKQRVRMEGESEIEWVNRQVAHNEAFDKWQNEEVTLALPQKDRDFVVMKAMVWAFGNRDKVFRENNDHVLSIIEAFSTDDE